jgi:hypothetical protein
LHVPAFKRTLPLGHRLGNRTNHRDWSRQPYRSDSKAEHSVRRIALNGEVVEPNASFDNKLGLANSDTCPAVRDRLV